MNHTVILAADPALTLGGGGATGTEVGTAAAAPVENGGGGGGFFGNVDLTTILLMYAAIIGMAWFLLIRPQRKQQKAMREMQEALKVGDNIVTSSGIYGTIVESGIETFTVEFGSPKSVRIPITKSHVVAVKEPK
ncbi:MAG: preprotein translocase subunit YajC [Defluviitaleaceae bacterium]|nr:preprotein translocase subunit YajC [Defluviitaleaceae bacterium]